MGHWSWLHKFLIIAYFGFPPAKTLRTQKCRQSRSISSSPLDDPGKNKIRCTPRGTKVAIYHIVVIFMLNSMHNVVSLATCAESL